MTIHNKCFVLLSGGLDSSTVLAMARRDFPDADIECVTIDYGQRHKKEVEYASYQAEQNEAEHIVIDIKGLLTGMLVDKGSDNEAIPDASYEDLPEGISPTYVSYRNGVMLSILAARAQGWIMEQEAKEASHLEPEDHPNEYKAWLYCGVHADDAARDAYPDCTPEFVGAQANAIYVGTYFKARLRAPIVSMLKSDVVTTGDKLGVHFEKTWSCYVGEEVHCGVCPTCRSRKSAFVDANVYDPTEYAA